jgi:hypothetical protein
VPTRGRRLAIVSYLYYPFRGRHHLLTTASRRYDHRLIAA